MKGIFSQGVAILTTAPPRLAELQALIPEHPFGREMPPAGELWMGGDSVVLDFLPAVNGRVQIDVVPRPWPDGMGNPKTEAMLFGAWTMGHFGPFAYPGGLARALQQAWEWPGAKDRAPQHTSFVRLRISYVFGAGPDAKVLPQEYHPGGELEFLVELALSLLKHPNALCYFNPSGEVLVDRETLTNSLDFHGKNNLPPLDTWSNIRLYDINPEWHLMDTVGLGQLDLPDLEAVFPRGGFDPPDVSNFLRNASAYILGKGQVIKHRDTMNGPGGRNWRAHLFESPLTDPPRSVICWLPDGVGSVPQPVLDRKATGAPERGPAPPKPKRWWQFK